MTDQHEFDANDDEAVNVFYDLTVWDADQRSALVESLAAASVPQWSLNYKVGIRPVRRLYNFLII